MSAHTPGPWEVVSTPQGTFGADWKEIRAGQKRVVSIGTFTRFGNWEQGRERVTHTGVAMSDADATLMAAAPAMKEALRAFLLPDRDHAVDCVNMADNEDTCTTECAGARRALRAAGVFP